MLAAVKNCYIVVIARGGVARGSVRMRFGTATVRAVQDLSSDSSSCEQGLLSVFQTSFNRKLYGCARSSSSTSLDGVVPISLGSLDGPHPI